MAIHPEIRILKTQDIERLGALHFPWTTEQKTIEKWQQYLSEQGNGIRVACIVESQGRILGYGSLLEHSKYTPFKNNGIPEIHDVWIFENERNKGFGSMLIRHLEKLAKKKGYPKIGIGMGLYRDYGAAQKLYF